MILDSNGKKDGMRQLERDRSALEMMPDERYEVRKGEVYRLLEKI